MTVCKNCGSPVENAPQDNAPPEQTVPAADDNGILAEGASPWSAVGILCLILSIANFAAVVFIVVYCVYQIITVLSAQENGVVLMVGAETSVSLAIIGLLGYILVGAAVGLYLGSSFLRSAIGYKITVTNSGITGRTVSRKVNLPLSDITSVTKEPHNAVTVFKGTKKFKFKKLNNREQVFNAINSLLSAREQQ